MSKDVTSLASFHLFLLDDVPTWQAFVSAWGGDVFDEATRVHFGCEVIARTVGSFADLRYFEESEVLVRLAAALIVGEFDVTSIWEARNG